MSPSPARRFCTRCKLSMPRAAAHRCPHCHQPIAAAGPGVPPQVGPQPRPLPASQPLDGGAK